VNKNAPSLSRIIVMIAFAFSCFAILLYLWVSFGGGVPLQAKGYRITAPFPEATTLANESDVRISGVKVGEVKTKELDLKGNATKVVMEIEPKYAPLPVNTRAILRQKTLLGETYVELTPGDRTADKIPDGGSLKATPSSSTRSSARSTPRRGARSRPGSTSRARPWGHAGPTSTRHSATWRRSPRTPTRCSRC
jgi:phospholipid/cholesterol/gamma-HCH transport system substrate-binding protein